MKPTVLDRQSKRVFHKTGLPPHVARLVAGLAYGGAHG